MCTTRRRRWLCSPPSRRHREGPHALHSCWIAISDDCKLVLDTQRYAQAHK